LYQYAKSAKLNGQHQTADCSWFLPIMQPELAWGDHDLQSVPQPRPAHLLSK
jgi:hypothetical protein